MKALFEINSELAELNGPATAVISQLEELATDDTFVGSRLFFTHNEAGAVAQLDARGDLLDQFVLGLTDKPQPSTNAKPGSLTITRYETVKEDKVTQNEIIRQELISNLWGDHDPAELVHSGTGNGLDLMPYEEADEDDEAEYFGAGGAHSRSFNQQKGTGPADAGEHLDLMAMNWAEPNKTKPAKNTRAAQSDVEPLPDTEALF